MIVTEYVPVGVDGKVEIVKADVAPDDVGVTGFVPKEHEAPEGNPEEQDNDTDDAEPLASVVVTVVAALESCATEPLDGFADNEKSNNIWQTPLTQLCPLGHEPQGP